MSFAIRALEQDDVDPSYMTRIAKLVTSEMISSKVLCSLHKHNSLVNCYYVMNAAALISLISVNTYFYARLYLLS